jgi:rhodanese-related sulfurtransferase
MTPQEVHRAWKERREIALIDLREEHVFARAHPLFAACLPLSRLELGLRDLIPRSDTPITVYDDGEGLVAPAIERLTDWGCTNVSAMDGGLAGWRAAGLELFADVNSPSKAFGELVEHQAGTPHVRATELQQWIDRKADVVILDARRFDEYATMTIPGSISVPGAELVLRAATIAPDPATTIIVNCAGRTRSIIGAQSLINAGLPNPVKALRNGTMGWTLDGQQLALGQARSYPEVDADRTAEAAERARRIAERAGVRSAAFEDLDALRATRTVYCFDVRSPAEHAVRHPAGFRSAPGGQLVQETDMFAPVRGAMIVLFDDRDARANMTASWLAQMGWDVWVLDAGAPIRWLHEPEPPRDAATPNCATIDPAGVAAALAEGALLLDLASSVQFRQGHIPGASFVMRGRLLADLDESARARPILLASPDGRLAAIGAAEVEALTGRPPRVLGGGTAAWVAAGGALESGFAPAMSPAEDVYRRPYEGIDNPREAMQAYFDWEYGLVAQLERDGSHGFFVLAPTGDRE